MIRRKPASYDRALRVLENPAMGGACAYQFRYVRDRSTPLRPVEERWETLQPEHHEGHASWQEWLEVQEQLAREGPAPLRGLVACGYCGYGTRVRYNAKGWGYQCVSPDPASRLPRGWFSPGGERTCRFQCKVNAGSGPMGQGREGRGQGAAKRSPSRKGVCDGQCEGHEYAPAPIFATRFPGIATSFRKKGRRPAVVSQRSGVRSASATDLFQIGTLIVFLRNTHLRLVDARILRELGSRPGESRTTSDRG